MGEKKGERDRDRERKWKEYGKNILSEIYNEH